MTRKTDIPICASIFGPIGPNGAGKTGLLKLVGRVLKPAQGQVSVRGCVAYLLALGASFHVNRAPTGVFHS